MWQPSLTFFLSQILGLGWATWAQGQSMMFLKFHRLFPSMTILLKASHDLICNAQSMTLSDIIMDIAL